jgi:hypothetical protein
MTNRRMDAFELDRSDERFDLVYCLGIFHRVENPLGLLRVLRGPSPRTPHHPRPGGRLRDHPARERTEVTRPRPFHAAARGLSSSMSRGQPSPGIRSRRAGS